MPLSDFHSDFFDVTMREDVAVVTITVPQLTDESNVEILGRDLFSLVEQYDQRKVVLSLERVDYLTSSVLGKLISLHRKMHRSEGKLVLCQLRPEVREVLHLSRLIDYFLTVETLDQALAAVQSA